MRLRCPAKVNLHLRVGPVRQDEFHPLLSWFCTAGLFDTLILEPADDPVPVGGAPLRLNCDRADLPSDQRNLVMKVGLALAERLAGRGALLPSVHATLLKEIPSGAGLGGGSSDGASALLGLNAIWNGGASTDDLATLAAKFGSDLPFFFRGPSSVCAGRGEIVRPIARPLPRWALLILPPIAMPTADVYRRFDAMHLGAMRDVQMEPDWDLWTQMPADVLLAKLVNDLEPAAFAINSDLAALRAGLEQQLQRPVRMSGSGSSLFTLYDRREDADRNRQRLNVPGARIVVAELAPTDGEDSAPGRSGAE